MPNIEDAIKVIHSAVADLKQFQTELLALLPTPHPQK